MANKIKPKRSYTTNAVPTTSDLDTHELAISWADGKAYTKNPSGNIVSVTLGGGGGSGLTWSSVPSSATATGTAGQIAYDGSYFYLATASSTWVRAAMSTWTLPVISIASQPSNQTASSGSATFGVTASVTASATLSYQWQQSTDSGSTFSTIAGATSASLSLTGLTAGDNASQYRVLISATGGAASVMSRAATLTVTATPLAPLSVSPSSGTSDSGTAYSWSGIGTADSPLQTSDAAAPNGITWGFAYGANTFRVWSFTCGISGTLTVEFGGRENDGPDIPNFVRYVRNNTVSTTFAGSQTFFGTHGARRTISVSAGDVIRLGSATGSASDWSGDHSYMKGQFKLWIS